jgi:hypothetical protein
MGLDRPERPPDEFVGADRVLWLRVMRVLRNEGRFQPTDAELISLFVAACSRARVARAVGRPDVEAERDAVALAGALLISPDARRRHDMNPKLPGGVPLTEATSSISGIW